MANRSVIKNNWPKYFLQWGSLAALIFFLSGLARKLFPSLPVLDAEAYCPMGGLEAISTYLAKGSLPCTMTSLQIVMGFALAASVILFSKLFCAFLCPIGTVEDLMIKVRESISLKSINIPSGSALDKLLRIVKYVLLFWIFYMTMETSELFCKNIDPYYAVVSGFGGETTLWMSVTALVLVLLGGLVVDRFWCRYICPLGAISNTLKFWVWILVLGVLYYTANLFGANISWAWMLGVFCFVGYLLEIISGRPKLQVLHMIRNEGLCNHCGRCESYCPYHINISQFDGKINSVDCTLCGDCAASCKLDALHVGMLRNTRNNPLKVLLPALLAVALTLLGVHYGETFEIPTINETWDLEAMGPDSTMVQTVDPDSLVSFEMENVHSVKCYGSSKAFAARLQKINGTHGVKTYVKSHKVVVTYDPATVSEESIKTQIFVPSRYRVVSLEASALSQLRVQTIRIEKMYDKLDLNYLGLQMKLSGKKVYGLESEYGCPVTVKVFSDPSEDLDKDWFKEIVNKESLSLKDGETIREIPLKLEFAGMEKADTLIPVRDYLHKMFDAWKQDFNGRYLDEDGKEFVKKRSEVYAAEPQFIYEHVNQAYEKPEMKRNLQLLANWLSSEEGVISFALVLNKNLSPAIQVRFAAPMTSEKLWKMMRAKTWTINYGNDDVREEPAKIVFDKQGSKYPVE